MTTPTLYEWAGGAEAFRRLTEVFYDRVLDDELLAPVFAHMSPRHREHVALWLGEVFGGPTTYTDELGGYPAMLAHHLNLGLTEQQRARWAALIAASADQAGLPDDPEFRSAFVAYVEWGTRLALANSQPGATPPPKAPVPRWGWGEAPPYQPG
ncbi:oxidoreductase [Kribbella sp. ALI-6-A]|uniref:group II truncated hemoglobin n=1 Tax=Kribbella sp. ALI-6-A TaxID=1933817 RepID=UPI00097C9B3D|nr:group II truncated hemoglobin [Kribbella sp. ALI-6-A]ONI67717.1 oxidoreductase [Kribbella sp. ALI-6-A]